MKNFYSRFSSVFIVIIICLLLPLLANTAQLFAQVSVAHLFPTNGTRGTSMTIYGAGFDTPYSGNTVIFTPVAGGAGTTATITAGTATQLTVTVPHITGGNYILSVQRTSDNTTSTAIEPFAIIIGGEGFGAVNSSKRGITTGEELFEDVHAGDVDGDGDIDFVSASGFGDTFAWHENNGSQNFTKHVVGSTDDVAYSIYSGDMDSDGDLDLIFGSSVEIAWYENDGDDDPSFTKHSISTNNGFSVFAADMDSDGDFDIVAGSQDRVSWYENNGGGDFGEVDSSEHVVSNSNIFYFSVFAADMDSDGDPDLMATSRYSDELIWYENNGGGDFGEVDSSEHVVSNSTSGNYVFAGDLDGDGDLDFMSSGSSGFSWHENDGATNPAFTTHLVSNNDTKSNGVYAGDMDGDGDLDMMATFSSSSSLNNVSWYENDGTADPSFTEHVVTDNTDRAYRVSAADVDSDGYLDIIYTSDGEISWFKNASAPSLVLTQAQPLNGSPGTSITIYGTNFDPLYEDNTVTFRPAAGGAATTATVTAGTATQLSVTVPDVSGGNYIISVQRLSDNSASTSLELFAVTTGGDGFGAVNSSEQVLSTGAFGASGSYAADVDGDDDIDLLYASSTDDKIVWYEYDGATDPVFTERVVSTSADGAQSVFAADVDGDGDMDILSASEDDDKIAWYENDGAADPAFTEQEISTSADGAQSVYAGDMDGDGDLDLMSASANDDKIAWYENDGASNPSFTEHVVSTDAEGASSVFAADIDGDGDIDLMSASLSDNKIEWYENDGASNPSFTEHVISTNADGASSVFAADVDGDGDLDLMFASANDDKIAWYENDGAADPAFTEQEISTSADGAQSVYAGDMDGDGDLDLLSASANDDKIAVYQNDGTSDPSFTEFVVSTNADGAQSVYAADVDSDGDLDLLSASFFDDKITWYENASTPPLIVNQVQPLNGTPGTSLTIFGANFDLTPTDNTVIFSPATGGAATTATVTGGSATKLTVTVPLLTGGNYSVRVQRTSDNTTEKAIELFAITTGGGSFGVVGSSERLVAASFPTSMYPVDIDGDGDLDLLSASTINENMTWYENDGTANPSFTEHEFSDYGAQTMFAADVDGDGDLDLISNFSSRIDWHENDGGADPSFTRHTLTTVVNEVTSVIAGDVDGDGDLDIMTASLDDDKIAWHENDGAAIPTFPERVVSDSADRARSVFAADVDGDGDLDLMSASENDDKIAWYENDGTSNPSFTEHVVSTNADGAHSVYARDVDGDGDLDLLSASEYDDKIAWYENDGASDPTFTEQVVSTNAGGDFTRAGVFLFAGDVDGDGDLDLMSADDSKIAWYENDGATDPSFTEHVVKIDTFTEYATSVYAADVDGDGDLDLLSTTYSDERFVWYKNSAKISGRALSLDGTDDFISVPGVVSALGADPDFTFEAWVKPDMDNQTEGTGILLSRNRASGGNVLLIGIENAGSGNSKQLRVFDAISGGDWEIASSALTSNKWYHVAYTLSSGTGTLFLDGEQIGQHTLNISLSTDDTLSIGQEYDSGLTTGNFLLADIDEVRFWDTALTQEQIQQNMYQALSGNEANLISYYSLDEDSGFDANDATTNGYDGTMYGSPVRSIDTHPYGTFVTGDEGWRMMTSPTGNTSYGTLLEDFWTQGFTGADTENGVPNVYTWSESDQEFQSITDADDKPAAGTGFLVYVYDDQNYDSSSDGFPKNIRVDNDQNEGIIYPTISYTNSGAVDSVGWNLVGNPYGATIDWDASSGLSTSNLDAFFYVWSDSAGGGVGNYLSWNGATGTFDGGEIAPWQGFWVKANANSPSLSFTNEARSAGGILRKQAPVPQITLTLDDGHMNSKAVVMFSEKASANKDRMDAYKLQSLNTNKFLSLFTQTEDGTGLEINALPVELKESLSISLGMDGSALSGDFELNWNPEHLPDGMKIVLIDTETGTEIDLAEASSYSFEIEPQAKVIQSESEESARSESSPIHQIVKPRVLKAKSSTSGSRFKITINSETSVSNEPGVELPTVVELQQNYPNPFNPSTTIAFGIPKTGKVTLEVFDILGRKVTTLLSGENKFAGRHTVNFNAANLASGMYIYRLKAGNTVITKKLTLIK